MKVNLIKLAKIASIAILPLAAVGCLNGGGTVTSSDGTVTSPGGNMTLPRGNGGPDGGSVLPGRPTPMGPSTGISLRQPGPHGPDGRPGQPR